MMGMQAGLDLRACSVCLLALWTLTGAFSAEADPDREAVRTSHVSIIIDAGGDGVEQHVADVLRDRILRRSHVAVDIAERANSDSGLRVYLGRRDGGSERFAKLVEHYWVTLPGKERVAPEGYAVKLARDSDGPLVIAEGADARGVLYAAGEVLRRFSYGPDCISLAPTDVSAAPAYRFRGSSANQGGTMRTKTGARAWTQQEARDYMLDFALAGANTFYASGADFDFVKQFDLMTVGGCRPNEYKGDVPPEWKAGGLEFWEGDKWVCPSVPEARAALLEQWDQEFAQTQDHDILRLYAGDPGGCRCPRCEPWGKTFVELCEEVAQVWLKHHPDSIVQIANQDLSNQGDQAIFDYLNAKPRLWLEGIAYGPGSNAMSYYFRDRLREDLFEYPGSGPVNRYLREILNNIPRYQHITHYSDITHWVSAQYMVENPEPHIEKVYGRRTFHTRPAAFYRIFQSIMPFSEGDIIYSEGYHDELHQYMWNRLLWNPNRSLEDVLKEYCDFQFGPEAAPDMLEAMLQLEKNLETPLAGNDGVDRFYLLVKEAGWKMPEFRMNGNYRWRLYMQKAALDKYVQLKLRRELERESQIETWVRDDSDHAVEQTRRLAAEPLETGEMAALREEAGRLGEESDQIMGVRNVGYFALDTPLTALDWTLKQLEAASQGTQTEQFGALKRAVLYEDPGPGGFYDDAGTKGHQPHLIKGEVYDASRRLDAACRPSQGTIAYDLEQDGVAFRYTDLDSRASYKVRLTMVLPRHWMETDLDPPHGVQMQNVLADGTYIAKDVVIPELTPQEFEYDIPRSATKDGSLTIDIERGEGSRGVSVSEVWLVKK